MKQILVIFDFSKVASHVFRLARNITSLTDGRVVMDPGPVGGFDLSGSTYQRQITILSGLMQVAESAMESLNSGLVEGEISYLIEFEPPQQALPGIIRHEEIDFVITTVPVRSLPFDFYCRPDLQNIVVAVDIPVLALHSAIPLDNLGDIN